MASKTKTPAGRARSKAVIKGASGLRRKLKESRGPATQRYVLRLYVTGTTPGSQRAIEQVRAVCEQHLLGRYQLEVIDIYQLPALAKDEQIVATPTLIKVLPAPLRRFIGNLSNLEPTLFGMDVRKA